MTNSYRIIISGTFFGSITADSEKEAKKLFIKLHTEFELAPEFPEYENRWVWKERYCDAFGYPLDKEGNIIFEH